MQNLFKQFIFEALAEQQQDEEDVHIPSRDDGLLVEPDFSADESDAEEKSEVSAVGASGGGSSIAGVTTPLGTGPTFPNVGKKRKPAWVAASSGFGGAKPKKN